MLIATLIYFLSGLIVASYLAAQRDKPREKEVGNWLLMLTSASLPLGFIVALVLWPVWLLFMCFPQESFVATKSPSTPPSIDYVGKIATVVIPLTPTGRIIINDTHRDARAESGMIPEGDQVLIRSISVGGEFVVKETNQPLPKPKLS
tara:strand:+ start:361 stop:804 length:444 start_codon:yes stop_codon:yes gene_type:complete